MQLLLWLMETISKVHCNSEAASAEPSAYGLKTKTPTTRHHSMAYSHPAAQLRSSINASPLSSRSVLLRLWNTFLVLYGGGWEVQEGKEIPSGSLPVVYPHLWGWPMLIFGQLTCLVMTQLDGVFQEHPSDLQFICRTVTDAFAEVTLNLGICIKNNANSK